MALYNPFFSSNFVSVSQNGTADYNGTLTSDIQAALDKAHEDGGGIVLLKSGEYEGDVPMTMPYDDVELWGSGWSTIIKPRAGMNADVITVTGKRCVIRNLKIDGNGANQTAGACIAGSGADDLHIDKVWFFKPCLEAVSLVSCDDALVENCKGEQRQKAGGQIADFFMDKCNYSGFRRCRVENSTLATYAFRVADTDNGGEGKYCFIQDCKLLSCKGIFCYNTPQMSILHNIFDSVTGAQLVMQGQTSNLAYPFVQNNYFMSLGDCINGNVVTYPLIAANFMVGGADGYDATLSGGLVFTGNQVRNLTGNGIAFTLTNSDSVIVANRILSCDGAGFSDGTGNDAVIVANKIDSNTGGDIISSGSRNDVSHNVTTT